MMKLHNFMVFTAVLCLCFVMAVGVQAQQKMDFEGEALLPPNANPGECFARVFVPPSYKTVSEQILRKEASNKLMISEPQFELVKETVMIQGPSERLELVDAQFEWIEEEVLVYPEHTHLEEVPAVYETVTEKVIDQPAHTIWKKGKGPIQKVDYGTGEIMCLVEVPATYKTITKRVLKTPATTREVINPAKYTIVKQHVMKTPPAIKKIEIPAQYKTVQVRKLVSPASIKQVSIPEEFQTVSRRELLTEGRMEWRPILCETNIRPGIVSDLQSALKKSGYNPGPIDGNLGRLTMAAVQSYQRDNKLPVGELTLETLKSLKVDF